MSLLIKLRSGEDISGLLGEGLLKKTVGSNHWSVALISWHNAIFSLNRFELYKLKWLFFRNFRLISRSRSTIAFKLKSQQLLSGNWIPSSSQNDLNWFHLPNALLENFNIPYCAYRYRKSYTCYYWSIGRNSSRQCLPSSCASCDQICSWFLPGRSYKTQVLSDSCSFLI